MGTDTKEEYEKNIIAHKKFVEEHVDDPKYKDRYAAFVKGNLEFIGDDKRKLVEKVHEKFGSTDMYVHRITRKKQVLNVPGFSIGYV